MTTGMIDCSTLPKVHTFKQKGQIQITIMGGGVDVTLNGATPITLKNPGLGFSDHYLNEKSDDTTSWTITINRMAGSPSQATATITMQAPIN